MVKGSSTPPLRRGEIVRLRVIAGVFGFFSLVGAVDYLMIVTHNLAYFEYLGYGVRQIAYFTDYPIALVVLLTLGVWGAVVGSALLIVRSRWAVHALGIAFVSQAVLNAVTFATRDRWDVLGPRLGTQDIIVMVLTFAITLFAVSLRRSDVLR